MAKDLMQMSQKVVADLYAVLGLEPPKDRMLNQIVIIVEAGKPVTIQERTYPLTEVPDPASLTPGQTGNA